MATEQQLLRKSLVRGWIEKLEGRAKTLMDIAEPEGKGAEELTYQQRVELALKILVTMGKFIELEQTLETPEPEEDEGALLRTFVMGPSPTRIIDAPDL